MNFLVFFHKINKRKFFQNTKKNKKFEKYPKKNQRKSM